MAIVDEQAGAAIGGDTCGNRVHQRDARRRQFDGGAVGGHGGISWQQCRIRRAGSSRETQLPVLVEADRALQPPARNLHILMDRDGVEQLVADDDNRPVGQAGNGLVPDDALSPIAERRPLHLSQMWACLDHGDRGALGECRLEPV